MRAFNFIAATVLFVPFVCALTNATAQTARPLPQPPIGVSLERGKYLVTVQDCNGCHTPFKNGEPDMTRMLSGHPQDVKVTGRPTMAPGFSTAINDSNTAWAGPWGVSFTTNLTPDRVTGIGSWNEETFINAIRQGKKSGVGRPLLPPMPWQMYGQLTDDDLKSILLYLKSIPAISNRVPTAIVPAPTK
jgi:hypothetical protein